VKDLPFDLPIGESFHFYIFEINEDRKTISLVRTEYLEQSEEPNYGEKIKVKYVKENHSKGYFYSRRIGRLEQVFLKKILSWVQQ
jgi:hypothetical protein